VERFRRKYQKTAGQTASDIAKTPEPWRKQEFSPATAVVDFWAMRLRTIVILGLWPFRNRTCMT
jgi:hypothetical protein